MLSATVDTAGGTVGQIGPGLLVLFCAERGDGEDDAKFYAEKIVKLRVFRDDAGKANLSVADIGGAVDISGPAVAVPPHDLARFQIIACQDFH